MIKNRRKIYQEINTQPTGSQLRDLKPIGISIPFNAEKGVFNQTYTNTSQVIENLRNLLQTHKGERIMQPEFGTDIHYYLFDKEEIQILFRINFFEIFLKDCYLQNCLIETIKLFS